MAKKKPRPVPQPAAPIPRLIDAHTHLSSCNKPVADLMQRAKAAGVELVCTVGDGLAETRLALAAAQAHQDVYAACAIHPTKADQLDDSAKAELSQLAADDNCVAIGETGLDTYWITHAPETTACLTVQQEALAWHVDLARQVNKPLMIHNREADAELLSLLAELPRPREVILHCFSSPMAVATEALARGYVLSFAGNVTFKRNHELRAIAAMTPDSQLLIETDAPYMTPEPYRGGRNEPALIGHTALCVAQARGVEPIAFAELMWENFRRIYQV